MGALKYVHEPTYAALILRRTFRDLNQPGAIMSRAKEWLANKDVKWQDNDKRFTFPSGATITFGYLDRDDDVYQYQSSEFQYIAFDELTQFTRFQYTYLISRCRRKQGSKVPLRIRSGSNPGGAGHSWVFNRFVKEPDPERPFVPAGLTDNPHIDEAEYRKALSNLLEADRKQLEEGDWNRPDVQGALWKLSMFDLEGFRIPEAFKRDDLGRVRYLKSLGIEQVVVGLDPTTTDYDDQEVEELAEHGKEPPYAGDKCGIVVVGRTQDARMIVLEDLTGHYSTGKWAELAIQCYVEFGAVAIVAEINQGGALVTNTIKGVAGNVIVKTVSAAMAKRARAEQVAVLYEQGRASHAGVFEELEVEMTTWDAKKPGSKSPNRVDALVWAAHGLGLCNVTGGKRTSRMSRDTTTQ